MKQTELDALIIMLKPQATQDTVDFVRNEIGRLLQGAYTNEYVPRRKLDIEVDAPVPVDAGVNVENDWSCTSQGERSEAQQHDLFDIEDYDPNDPRNW